MRDGAATTSSDVNVRIARSVRGLRSDQGLSIEALAEKSAVSRSMISLIERGETSATAVILEKLAAGFGVPLASLFEDPEVPASPVSRRPDRTSWRDPESGYVRRNISPPNHPSPIQIVDVMLPAGARVAYESGSHGATIHQQIWVKEGKVEVTANGATHALETDDCLAMTLDAPTAFRNRTRKPARYAVVIASHGKM